MSNRSAIEFNHDYYGTWDSDPAHFVERLLAYFRSGDKKQLPTGAALIRMRHHSEPPPEITLGSSSYTQPPIPNAVSIALQIVTQQIKVDNIELVKTAHDILKNYLQAELEGQTKITKVPLTNP